MSSEYLDELLSKINVVESEELTQIRKELMDAIEKDPSLLWINRVDVLIQDLVTSAFATALKQDDLVKHEEWAELGPLHVLDQTRVILRKEYNDMATFIAEVAENPSKAQELLQKHFPNGIIGRYDYDSIKYD